MLVSLEEYQSLSLQKHVVEDSYINAIPSAIYVCYLQLYKRNYICTTKVLNSLTRDIQM